MGVSTNMVPSPARRWPSIPTTRTSSGRTRPAARAAGIRKASSPGRRTLMWPKALVAPLTSRMRLATASSCLRCSRVSDTRTPWLAAAQGPLGVCTIASPGRRVSSVHYHTAVDDEGLRGDHVGVVGGEEHDGAREVGRLHAALDELHVLQALEEGGVVGGDGALAADEAGDDAVHVDALAAHLGRQGAREADDSRLGG